MTREFFHAWERRLHAVSKDRVVRPFEWGLDWIETNGHSPGAPPDGILLDWASHAVPTATASLKPPTLPITLRARADGSTGEVSFPSAIKTPLPREQRRCAALSSLTRRHPPPKARRAVVVLPQWNAGPDGHVGLCRLLNRFGISALRLTLPYHDARRPAALTRADYIVSANVAARRRLAARP